MTLIVNPFALYPHNSFSPSDVSGLVQWLKADAIVGLNDGDAISTWADSSGNGKNATQSGAQRPVYKTGILNSLPVVRFTQTSTQYFNCGDFSSLTESEVFVVLKLNNDPPLIDGKSALWSFDPTGNTLFPYSGDGKIYDAWGTNSRKTTVNPTTSLASWCIYSVHSAAGDWSNYLNGTVLFHTASNTVAFHTACKLGYEAQAGYYFDGDMAEFFHYNHKLTSEDRSSVMTYLQTKYAL